MVAAPAEPVAPSQAPVEEVKLPAQIDSSAGAGGHSSTPAAEVVEPTEAELKLKADADKAKNQLLAEIKQF